MGFFFLSKFLMDFDSKEALLKNEVGRTKKI